MNDFTVPCDACMLENCLDCTWLDDDGNIFEYSTAEDQNKWFIDELE